jgi:acyl-CoA reductase-like NAD-dependent aldehyde dehydrogenase
MIFKKISLTERISIIENSMSWFKANKEKVAISITNQMGKPLTESLREIDVKK